jgi:Protein of unknown function (DUF3501)
MPREQHLITPADILPAAQFAAERSQRRAALLPIKQLRRVDVGPHCTFYFESFETMLFQVQEMLHIEGGGDAQLADELAAYNPLIPKGEELVATIMFEIDEPERRARVLARLGGVERHFFIQVGAARIAGQQETDAERTREDGKASSVQFAHFHFTADQQRALADPGVQALVGVDHPEYAHLALLSPATRAELATDFA